MKTLIYSDGGNVCLGKAEYTAYDLRLVKQDHKDVGAVGYMVGYRYWDNAKEKVIVFFDEQPSNIYEEEQRRRNNGFLGAKYYSL